MERIEPRYGILEGQAGYPPPFVWDTSYADGSQCAPGGRRNVQQRSDRTAALRRCSGAVKSGCLVADYAQEGVQHLADTSGRLICIASRSAFSARVGFPIGLQSIALIRAYQKETPP